MSSAQSRAWVEIDLRQLGENFRLINKDKPPSVRIVSVVKDNAYGHGAVAVAEAALLAGALFLATATVEEALALRRSGLRQPILLFGERHPSELPACLEHDLTPCLGEADSVRKLAHLARAAKRTAPVHIKIDTGMSRYGARWSSLLDVVEEVAHQDGLFLEGVMSHFAMSDELDKTFAMTQLDRFNQALATLAAEGIRPRYRHMCNSGGLLDLPQAHFDMARIGILPLGVYPSQVCRRIEGIQPIMKVKARVAFLQNLEKGDTVGYGMRYAAPAQRRIAVIPIGYGDGFPRVRNQGHVLIHGRRAELVGGVSMDALAVDVTHIPEVRKWDEVTVLGADGAEEITIHDIARLKNSVSYDAMVAWRSRLPRVYLNPPDTAGLRA